MKRIRLLSIVTGVIVLGGMAMVIFRAREPRCEGRTLTDWLENSMTPRQTQADWQAAGKAVKQMAPEALPFLLKWVQAKDSPLKMKVAAWAESHPAFHLPIKKAFYYHTLTYRGFFLLGNDAKSAWPALIQLTYSPDAEGRYWALVCLAASKPDKETFLPVLIRLIHDPEKWVQQCASVSLDLHYSEDAEAAGVYKKFPNLRDVSTNQNLNQP